MLSCKRLKLQPVTRSPPGTALWYHRNTLRLRAVKMAATMALPDGAARKALTADIKADDARAPIPALMQLAWGQVKCLEGYPELQDIYDLGQTRMTDVI